ncbi:MAG: 16S rRNA (adenine(1518)-N(6)/adenine(1519)-N(6))-dimethyltransferase RsmA [Lachnospiraceae bacterium]|nr:16S rRNA (adenine(1518)-N(6)/adenine(1519)-N(6))-dimethyltransferase RsmA [Lachnospiraceae bacterium]
MSVPTSAGEAKRLLSEFGLHAKKKYGQNFLTDTGLLDDIVNAAGVEKDDVVLEIGPGLGCLTARLAEAAEKVIAVEIDTSLLPLLQKTLEDYSNIEIINEDVLKLDLGALAAEKAGNRKFKVVANLPYYITTPIIMALLEKELPIESITVMVQLEVAQRLEALPGSKEYGAITLSVAYYTKPEIVLEVPREAFMPSPNVDSAVIKLTVNEEAPVKCKDTALMWKIIRAAFNQRRKTLSNALSGGGICGGDKSVIKEAMEDASLEQSVRGETLSLEDFARLTDSIVKVTKR